jgi:hypothetical protein
MFGSVAQALMEERRDKEFEGRVANSESNYRGHPKPYDDPPLVPTEDGGAGDDSNDQIANQPLPAAQARDQPPDEKGLEAIRRSLNQELDGTAIFEFDQQGDRFVSVLQSRDPEEIIPELIDRFICFPFCDPMIEARFLWHSDQKSSSLDSQFWN